MTPEEHERYHAALESRLERVARDASAARHLAAAQDRDIADLGVKVDAHRKAINALSEQTAARFDALEGRFDALEGQMGGLEGRMDGLEQSTASGFAQVRGQLDGMAARQEHVVGLLTRLIDDESD